MAKKKNDNIIKRTFQSINSFLEDEKVKKIAGLFFFVISTYLIVSFISYLFHGKVDQDKIGKFTQEIQNFGGSLELWDKKMENCVQKILPVFNRMVIFSTTDFSYHGNPDKVNCSSDNSRKSIAMYYYSNGRPNYEKKLGLHSTIFRKRPKQRD